MTPSVAAAEQNVSVGIDLGGTTLTAVVVDREGKRLAHRTTPADVHRGPDAVISDMVELVDALLAEASLDSQSPLRAGAGRKALIAVGVAAPGPLSPGKPPCGRSGRIIRSANLPGWVDVPLCDRLGETLQVPITLENDGNAAAFGEFWLGAGRDGADLVMLTLGTGVGGGVIINGQILHGHFENAGELGHMIVVHDGLPCSCGQRGCLEQYASAGALARRAAAGLERGDSGSLAEAVNNGAPIDSETVVRCARAGDELCLRIWDEACFHLGVACITIQHAFNPSRIVLGGGMSEAGSFLVDRVTHHMHSQRWKLHEDLPAIVPARLGRDAGAIGAAGLAMRNSVKSEE